MTLLRCVAINYVFSTIAEQITLNALRSFYCLYQEDRLTIINFSLHIASIFSIANDVSRGMPCLPRGTGSCIFPKGLHLSFDCSQTKAHSQSFPFFVVGDVKINVG